jgi:hypothetical protein
MVLFNLPMHLLDVKMRRMKKCFKCGEIKPLDQFYAHRGMADGHLNKCKTCAKFDVAERERIKSQDFEWYEKELERHRLKSARRRKEGFKSIHAAAGLKAWQIRNKFKRRAHHKVQHALRSGKLTREPCCICGDPKTEGHHDDYSKPLNVRWLCKKHHDEVHLELNRLRRKERFERQQLTRQPNGTSYIY